MVCEFYLNKTILRKRKKSAGSRRPGLNSAPRVGRRRQLGQGSGLTGVCPCHQTYGQDRSQCGARRGQQRTVQTHGQAPRLPDAPAA